MSPPRHIVAEIADARAAVALFGERGRHAISNELARPVAERTRWLGTVMGLSGSKVHVLLDSPSIDVKIYWFDLGKAMGGAWLELADAGATLRVQNGATVTRVGDPVRGFVSSRDVARDRWVLLPERDET